MAAPYHKILSKVDRALVAYLISKNAGTAADTFPNKSSFNKRLPCTICASEEGKDLSGYSADFTIQSSIIVETAASIDVADAAQAARLASDARVGLVFDAFFTDLGPDKVPDFSGDKLAADITTAARAAAAADPTNNADLADLTIQNCKVAGVEAGFKEDGSAWRDVLNLEILANPSNVS
jgi:hypothetical protein